jgi:putative peptidoglycan lipid II flippase
MIRRAIDLFLREISSIHVAAFVLAGSTFLSLVLAFFRDRLLASTFGAGVTLDIYYAAFRIPDLFFVIIGSAVSLSVLVPVLTKLKSNKDDEQIFLNTLFSFVLLLSLVASIILFIFLPLLLGLLFDGFTAEQQSDLVATSRIMLLSPIFLILSSMFSSVVQVHKRFFVYALSPVMYNIGIIFGVLFLSQFGVKGLAVGVVIGAFLHFSVQALYLKNISLMPKLSLRNNYHNLLPLLALSVPRSLTLAATQIVVVMLSAFASHLRDGSLAIFTFAQNLQNVPLALIGVSYSIAVFPTLSQIGTDGKSVKHDRKVGEVLKIVLYLTIPLALFMVIARIYLVRIILGAGEFTWTDTRLTAATLGVFLLSVPFQSASLVLIRSFYSRGKTFLPLMSALLLLFLTYFVYQAQRTYLFFENETVLSVLRLKNVVGAEVLGLSLAFTVASLLQALFLVVVVRFSPKVMRLLVESLVRTLAVSALGGLVMFGLLRVGNLMFGLSTTLSVLLVLLIASVATGLTFWLLSYVFSITEYNSIVAGIRQKLAKRR